MSGIEFIQACRADPALHREVIFVLTTSRRDEDKLASYELNVAGYIVKSHVGEDFLGLVELLGAYWRVVELPE